MSPVALAVCSASAFTSGCNDREAATGIAGARRFNGGIERQQIGLAGNRVDQLDNIADPRGRLGKLSLRDHWSCGPVPPRSWRYWLTPEPHG